MVYVINKNDVPLMPTTNVIARILLKQNKAKVIKKTPFTIKLLYSTSGYTQNLILGIDTGSSKIGSAVVDSNNNVIYLSQIEIRNDISEKMKQRSIYRHNRRNRKTRYRKSRWLNRKNSIKTGRLTPTMISKINSHIKEINFVKTILPINKIILEVANFDPHALKNPEVLKCKWLYQKGINYRYANTKAYVLDRDNYICKHCKGKSKDNRLEVHHIIFRCNGGSDESNNLIVLCKTCHDNLHSDKITLKKSGKLKGVLKHTTQMNIIRHRILKLLPEAEETYGFITKEHRQLINLPKEHVMDAVTIASQGNKVIFKNKYILFKRCVSDGDYQQHKGIRSEIKIPTNKIYGFRKFDKVKYLGNEYFIKGRMSTGYAILMNIEGKKINLKPIPKFNRMIRLGARKSWIILENPI
jgi:5-methylcytosine-specific restriction endonuclease McrA